MSKTYLYLGGGIALLLVIAGGYLLLSRSNNNTSYPGNANTSIAPTSTPITTQNADESLSQTDANVQTQLNQADQDVKAAQESNTSTTSQEDLNSINNL